MSNYINLLASADTVVLTPPWDVIYPAVNIALIICMALSAAAAIILILLQPSNSSGIDALGGSSETFFGKNKGKSIEEKMKKWTWICLAVLVAFSIVFFIFNNPALIEYLQTL